MKKERLLELAGIPLTEENKQQEWLDIVLKLTDLIARDAIDSVNNQGGELNTAVGNLLHQLQADVRMRLPDVLEKHGGVTEGIKLLNEAKELSREQVTKAVAKMAAEQAVVIVDEIANGGDHFYPAGIEEWLQEQGLTRAEMNIVWRAAADKLLKRVK